MARKPIDYVAKAKKLGWDGLDKLWQKIQARKTTGWPPGKAFEHLILRAFDLELEAQDGAVEWPYPVSLYDEVVEQIDGLVRVGHVTCLIEAKDQKDKINIEPLAKLRNQLMRRPSFVVGSVFTTSEFTEPAKILARFMSPHAIMLWNGDEIAEILRRRDFKGALITKYHEITMTGTPDYDVRAAYDDEENGA